MFAAQDPSSVILVILVVAAAAVLYWRTVIKLLTIGTVMLVVLGLLDLLQSLH
jgi:hypothetical protein